MLTMLARASSLRSALRALPLGLRACSTTPVPPTSASSTTPLPDEAVADPQSPSTHFGFKTVAKEEKQSMVGEVFHRVADRYDVMNDFMSAGIHRYWKDQLISQLRPAAGGQYLDVAGGTGDVAFRIIESLQRIPMSLRKRAPKSVVTIADINPSMLAVGQQRAKLRGFDRPGANIEVEWLEGNAEALTVPDESKDAYTIAFGIRNVTNIDKALADAYRVLKKGGRFMCLEFSQVPNPLLRQAYDLYSFNVIPTLGQVVANDRDSYQYLVESIRQFPNQETFAEMIRAAGFRNVTYTNYTFGVAAIHSGFKL